MQSFEFGEAKPGEGRPRRHIVLRDEKDLIRNDDETVKTNYENFVRGCKIAGDFSVSY